ncbi:MAG TPA: hypothetical protein VIU65_01350 [Pyrinomonadaceae bacterium]
MKVKLFLFIALMGAISLTSAITSAQRRPADDKPITGDFKITTRMTVAGNATQSTTMIKGKRERTETSISAGAYSMSTVNITQCDMRRTIQVNDKARRYLITPMDLDDTTSPTAPRTSGGGTSQRGGVITMSINTVDTGERKEMFGFTARHLKRTLSFQSSPDACNAQQMKIDTDGWYINLEYGLNCGSVRPQTNYGTERTGCRDRYEYKITGPQNIGYPLLETTTMYGADGSVTTTITKEVIELSRQTLDASLFDIPAGYTEAKSQQDMYPASSMAEAMGMSRPNSNQTSESGVSTATSTAKVRVGVAQFNNKTKTSASTDSLRDQLVAVLTGEGIDAVALNASSPSEAVIEAQSKDCAYILFTDIATLKSPSTGKKIGGIFGRAAGVGSSDAGKAEVRLDYRLVPTASSSAITQSSASAKEETQEAGLTMAITNEARAVAGAVPRN